MIIGVPKESVPGERRVALVPDAAGKLAKAGHEIRIESGAGANRKEIESLIEERMKYYSTPYEIKWAEVARTR